MQTQHLIIIAACSIIGLLLMAYFIRRAIVRTFARMAEIHTAELNLRREHIAELSSHIAKLIRDRKDTKARRRQEIKNLKDAYLSTRTLMQDPDAPIFGKADHQLLMQVHVMLLLAKQTWHAMPGTEPIKLKAETQAQKVLELADRISNALQQGVPA